MKRFFSILLSFAMILSVLLFCGIPANAQDGGDDAPDKREDVVFSYDPKHPWVGTVSLYVLNTDGRLVREDGEEPEDWVFRARLTDDNFGYRPAPLSQAGGINTRLFALRLPDSLVLTEWDTAFVAAGPNAPRESSTYSLWRVDPAQGIELVLEGVFNATYDKTAFRGDLEPVTTGYRLNGEKCTEAEFFSAFEEYEIEFSYSMISVTEKMRESFLTAKFAEGEILLPELRSDVEAELPPAWEELAAAYGVDELPEG